MVEHVGEHLVEERAHARLLDLLGHDAERLLERRLHDRAAQLLGARHHLVAQHHDLVEDPLQLLRELAVPGLEGRGALPVDLALLGQALQLVQGDGPVLDRRQDLGAGHRTNLHLHQRETGLAHAMLEPLDQLLLPGFEVLDREFEPALEILPVEHPGQARREVAQQLVELVAEHDAAAGGHAQQLGLLRVGEVVDERQVVRRCALGGQRSQVQLDRRHPSGAGEAGDEDVEPQRLDRKAELERPDRAFLADDPVRRLDLRRGVARKPSLRAPPPQVARRKLSCHRRPPQELAAVDSRESKAKKQRSRENKQPSGATHDGAAPGNQAECHRASTRTVNRRPPTVNRHDAAAPSVPGGATAPGLDESPGARAPRRRTPRRRRRATPSTPCFEGPGSGWSPASRTRRSWSGPTARRHGRSRQVP